MKIRILLFSNSIKKKKKERYDIWILPFSFFLNDDENKSLSYKRSEESFVILFIYFFHLWKFKFKFFNKSSTQTKTQRRSTNISKFYFLSSLKNWKILPFSNFFFFFPFDKEKIRNLNFAIFFPPPPQQCSTANNKSGSQSQSVKRDYL